MAPGSDSRLRQLADQSSAVVLATHVEPTEDIAAERRRASFDPAELAAHLNGGAEKLKRRAELAEIAQAQPWGDKSLRYFHTREEEYVKGLEVATGIWDLIRNRKISLEEGKEMRKLVNMPGGLELHIGMFIPTLLGQADADQQAKWLPLAQTLRLVGTYAQTELGHGTFVRGLETTATYDPSTKQFVINTPNLTATKWWPGGLGKTATHVVLMARLFVGGKDYGPHGFIVQIRDMETHLPLPGVTVGDIGPKFGYNGVDNGYLSFSYTTIPLENMLMRFAKVTPDGKYLPPPPANAKASYATMIYVRATIVEDAGWILARAVTIAVRYNAVRRQTAARAGERELQVLDYQNTAADLLPRMAAAYSLIFMGQAAMKLYAQFEEGRDKGDFTILPELHSMLAGLKAASTWETSEGIEACRRCCGGHGYSRLSGLPDLYASYVQNATWEGDNNVLCLQTARFLLKALEAAQAGKPLAGSSAYLAGLQDELNNRCKVESAADWLRPGAVLAALRHRATRLALVAAEALRSAGQGRLQYEGAAWNATTCDLINLAKAHSALVLQANFEDSLARLERLRALSAATLGVLRELAGLAGLTALRGAAGDLLEGAYLTGRQAAAARAAWYDALRRLRPQAVALVDAFAFEDYLLHSCLGRADGDVYRALLEAAQRSPLNASQEGPAWHGVLEPRLNPSSVARGITSRL